MADGLALHIVEGPGAGQRLAIDREISIGRAPDNDLVLAGGEVSAHHARIAPAADGSAVVEDLDSVNGTFVNTHEVRGTARLDPGDELLIGVTVMRIQSSAQEANGAAMVAIPRGLAATGRPTGYVNPSLVRAETGAAPEPEPLLRRRRPSAFRQPLRLVDLTLFVLVGLALIVYFLTR
jgi:predicted component of type VI protein secretion system